MRTGMMIALPVVALFVAVAAVPPPAHSESESKLATKGLHISPVNLNLRNKNRTLVGFGSYIVNAQAGCNDCHTNPPYTATGNPFNGQPEQVNTEGFLAGGNTFGPVTSRNLTPDGNGKPAGMTLKQFIHTIRTGADDEQPGQYLQVMPWPVYRKMSDHELTAIYEYLRAIPAVSSGTKPAHR